MTFTTPCTHVCWCAATALCCSKEHSSPSLCSARRAITFVRAARWLQKSTLSIDALGTIVHVATEQFDGTAADLIAASGPQVRAAQSFQHFEPGSAHHRIHQLVWSCFCTWCRAGKGRPALGR